MCTGMWNTHHVQFALSGSLTVFNIIKQTGCHMHTLYSIINCGLPNTIMVMKKEHK
jgi:hypothetical protein